MRNRIKSFCKVSILHQLVHLYVQVFERVQRRATRMVKGLKKFTYGTRLKRLGIYSLERRRYVHLIEIRDVQDFNRKRAYRFQQILRTVSYKWTTRSLSEAIQAKMLHNELLDSAS